MIAAFGITTFLLVFTFFANVSEKYHFAAINVNHSNSSLLLNELSESISIEYEFEEEQNFTVRILIVDLFENHQKSDLNLLFTKTAVSLAFVKLENLYPFINFTYKHIPQEVDCRLNHAAGIIAEEHLKVHPVTFLVGPLCSTALHSIADLASYWKIPLCTGAGQADQFSDREVFSTLIRISPTTSKLSKLFVKIMFHFNWRHVFVLTDIEHFYSRITREGLESTFNIHPEIVPFFKDFNSSKMDTDFEQIFESSKLYARVLIILAKEETVRNALIAAHSLGMHNGDFAFISVQWTRAEDFKWMIPSNIDNEIVRRMCESLLLITLSSLNSNGFDKFENELKAEAAKRIKVPTEAKVNLITASFYECLLMYGFALNKTRAERKDPTNGINILNSLRNTSFSSTIFGEIYIDSNGDREADFKINEFNERSLAMESVAIYLSHLDQLNFINESLIKWPKGQPPNDKPECGFDGSECDEIKSSYLWIVLATVLTTVALFAVFCILVYRKFQFEAELSNLWWKVSWDEIHFSDGFQKSTSTVASENAANASQIPPFPECPDVCQDLRKQNSEKNNSGNNVSFLSTQMKRSNQLIGGTTAPGTRVGVFKNIKVAVKILNVETLSVTREILMELKQVRDLVHENLIRFMGLCVDESHIALITEYCSRGSLRELLLNDSIHLDWCFRFSIISDIVDGMAFIHSCPINYHGRLKSSNCVIDNHFIVKLTDFGLSHLMAHSASEEGKNSQILLYIAPEHLRSKEPLLNGSQKGDVYSFAIVVQEIITRKEPFGYDPESLNSSRPTLNADEILNMVRLSLDPPFRPILPKNSEIPQELIDLVTKCWKENPWERPTFYSIKMQLKQLTKAFGSSNLLDNLLRRMEQYTDNLEQLVEEKTAALVEEKKRSDELLYELLPKYVVKQLKNGNSVEPEEFECVTICFTDIQDFTKISAESSPIEVRIKTFRIKHAPERKLMLRIGMHSGPCAAGVVGSRMPRYCLFGDTVNTASRMESYGEAMKIHISEESKQILDQFKTFETEPRGEIDIKGKGMMSTYWLIREQNN
ncbi:atrial natriuretic peptide receptor 1-like protein [Dinothrombium tinctorium]|uniref:Guanylate cyclase n=1 Tax=Dinothrombium tinctorium TaxID=1965070 RepID=A0A3S3PB13_9ACAR|nr:atrial natriuretic peptide receptor 1-like protein [Dinothrombium tinctorium]RWS11673.1 atrial natriuretic peptide receptor 1-like protein [Dinothrombium tinctorium]RWS11866.1 atrial natriuretic peptide receptor 1-like protein [Dinothrombium tinctorium]